MPPEDGLQFSTATAPAAISSSAETRSMSRWSTSAMSPRTRWRTSSFVRRPGRTGPCTARASRGPAPATAGPEALRLLVEVDGLAAIDCESNARAHARALLTLGRSGRAHQRLGVPAGSVLLPFGSEHPRELLHDLLLLTARARPCACPTGPPA